MGDPQKRAARSGALCGAARNMHGIHQTKSGNVFYLYVFLHHQLPTSSTPSQSLFSTCPLLLDLLQLHINPLEAPALPEGWVQERPQIEAIIIRRCKLISHDYYVQPT